MHSFVFPPSSILALHLLQWLWNLWCVTRYTYPFAQTALLANVHCMVWFKTTASAMLTSATPSTLDPHRNFSQVSCCCPSHGDPVALVLQNRSLHALQPIIDGVDDGVGQFKTLDVGLGSS